MDAQTAATTTTQSVEIVKALAPLFAAGLAIQQGTELLDSFLSPFEKVLSLGAWKKFTLKLIAFVLGLWFVNGAEMTVLKPLGVAEAMVGGTVDHLVAALIVSGGTESINSIVKFLGYAKEDKKASAGVKQANATPEEKEAIAKMGTK